MIADPEGTAAELLVLHGIYYLNCHVTRREIDGVNKVTVVSGFSISDSVQ